MFFRTWSCILWTSSLIYLYLIFYLEDGSWYLSFVEEIKGRLKCDQFIWPHAWWGVFCFFSLWCFEVLLVLRSQSLLMFPLCLLAICLGDNHSVFMISTSSTHLLINSIYTTGVTILLYLIPQPPEDRSHQVHLVFQINIIILRVSAKEKSVRACWTTNKTQQNFQQIIFNITGTFEIIFLSPIVAYSNYAIFIR